MKVHVQSAMAAAATDAGDDRFPSHFWEGDLGIEGTEDPLETCEALFRFFNRVDAEDGPRLESIGYRLPSLSVGDRLTFDEKTYEVQPIGFAEVPAA